MAATLVGGAALGPVFDILYQAVIHAATKVAAFRGSLNKLKRTMFHIQPIFKDIAKLNTVLQRPQDETDLFITHLRQGENIVRKCLKIKSWNLLQKYRYAKKLDSLEEDLMWFFQVFVTADTSRDVKRVRVVVEDFSVKMDQVVNHMNVISLNTSSSLNTRSVGYVGCCNVPISNELVVGFEVPLEEVKKMILKNESEKVVVISAPGGCGKSTLAKRVCIDDEIKGIYEDNIFFVEVKKTTTLIEIVQNIVKSKGVQLPQLQSDRDAKIQLDNFLKVASPGPALVVLDDVWLELESLIEDLVLPIPKYKILVTSRCKFPRFSSTYTLKPLSDEDAMTLFHHSAFKDKTPHVGDNIVHEIVRSCGGFPLALTVVGQSLHGRVELQWLARIQKCGQTIFPSNDSLLGILRSSVDELDEKLKECYLDLALFPNRQRTAATALRDIWVELYNLAEDGVNAVAFLFELSARNLVNLTLAREGAADIIDNCNDHFVTQHDLLRELAIYLSSQTPENKRKRLIMDITRNEIPKYWTELNKQQFDCKILSISTDEMFSSIWPDIQLPEVKVLLLNFHAETYSLPEFVEGMRQLKVMIITNNGSCAAKLNLPPLDNLRDLKRITLEYISLSSFDWSQSEMSNLQKISMISCEIGEAFENCTRLASMWLNLTEINIDHCQDLVRLPSELCQLVHLQKLCITYSQELEELPEDIGCLTELQVLRLHSCTRLLELPEAVGNLQKLVTLDISDSALIENIPNSIGQLCSLREINMRGCSGILDLPSEVKDLTKLELVICDQEMAYVWQTHTRHLSNLKIDVPKDDVNLRWLPKFQD